LSIGGAFRYAERVKLATYAVQGKVSYGAVVGDGVVDLRRHLGESRYPTLKSVLEAGALGEARKAAVGKRPDHRLADVELRPVIPDAAKILCVGLNYHAHRDETGHRDPTAHPALFIRYPDTQVFKIEMNYRSVPEILEVANAAIAANVEQFRKSLQPTRKSNAVKPALVALNHQPLFMTSFPAVGL